MDKCLFLGRLSKDVELRATQSGKSVANFSIAVDTGYGENKKANFFNVVAFDKNADNIAKFFHKGDRIALETEAQQNVWTDKEGQKHYDVNFVVRSWEFCESTKGREEQKPGIDDFMAIPDTMEEDLPFL